MAFKEFIFNHFPHRWLNIKKEGTKRLFTGLGNIFDGAEEYARIPSRNNSTRTAKEALSELENEYGIAINPSIDIDIRRAKIIMKKRMQDCPITKSDLIKILQAVGIEMHIVNFYNASIMVFTVLSNYYALPYKEILNILYENVRAHVGIEVECPVSFNYEVFVGIHVSTQHGYDLNFLPFDTEVNIMKDIYMGAVILPEKEYNIS